jgi:hypothetical protein
MRTVLLLNNTIKNCGIQQWGIRLGDILPQSTKYRIVYRELHTEFEYFSFIQELSPDIIIYNYHIDTMKWLKHGGLYNGSKHIAIIHEGFSHLADPIGFDLYIYVPENVVISDEWRNRVFTISRPLLTYKGDYPVNDIPTIGSFGFGFKHKQFPLIVKTVNQQFDIARIRFNIPHQFNADPYGLLAKEEIRLCRKMVTKPGIQLEITEEFKTEEDNLTFLAGNDINAFFYDSSKLDSSSGATDFALSVDRPIAITFSPMFKHIIGKIGTAVCIEKHSFQELINQGTSVLQPLKDEWSNTKLMTEIEDILDRV